MNISKVELPSNQKFGIFFTVLFFALSVYFFFKNIDIFFYLFGFFTIAFFTITIIKADFLHPLNKLWMRFGILLGIIMSPIILGIIYFLMFTPMAIPMRILGRDELKLRFKKKNSYWIQRDNTTQPENFKYQF